MTEADARREFIKIKKLADTSMARAALSQSPDLILIAGVFASIAALCVFASESIEMGDDMDNPPLTIQWQPHK